VAATLGKIYPKLSDYQKDNYYLRNAEPQKIGQGWQFLPENIKIDNELYQMLAQGKTLDGQEVMKAPNGEHRAGWDLVFSPDKSFSIYAFSSPEAWDQVQRIHQKAVADVYEYLEKNLIQVRIQENGEKRIEKTGNLIALKVDHFCNRNLEDDIHSHFVFFNLTYDSNGNVKALHSDAFHSNILERIYENQMAFYARQEGLATYQKMSESGKSYYTALLGISEDLVKAHSQRSEDAKQFLKQHIKELKAKYPNASPGELKRMAIIETRQAKQDVTLEDIYKNYDETNAKMGVTREDIYYSVQQAALERHQAQGKTMTADEIVDAAARALTEQESTFARSQYIQTAAKLSAGDVSIHDIEKVIQDREKQGENIVLSSDIAGNGRRKYYDDIMTTKEMLATEKDIIAAVSQGKGTMQSISSQDQIHAGIAKYETEKGFQMTQCQRQAVEHILSSRDQVIGIQGDAGTGKTTVLDFVRQEAERAGYQARGFSFTGKAAKEIEKASGIKSQTVDSFLAEKQEHGIQQTDKRQIWIVDEASMLGSRKMHEFLQYAQQENAKVVLVGDTKQLQSVEAGRMFYELQRHGIMETVRMSEVQRQKNEAYKAIVASMAEKKIDQAVEKMEKQNRLYEIADREQRFQAIKSEYMKDPNKTVVVTALNRDRNEINAMIRDELNAQGKLGYQDYTFTVRESKGLQPVEKHFSQNYESGDIVVANKAGIFGRAGAEARVMSVDQQNHTITVQTRLKDGMKTCKIDLKEHGQDLQVYHEKEIKLARGDRVVFTKNDRGLSVKNGQTGIVNEISSDGKVTVVMDKETRTFNVRSQYNYIDYGYAVTAYKSQGQTVDRVLYSADTKTVNYNQAYVAITRGKYDMKIYTDSKEELKEGMKQEQAKTSTLDYNYRTNQNQQKDTKTEKIEQAKQTKGIAGQAGQPEKTTGVETYHVNSYVSRFSSEPTKRGWFDKVQLLQGTRNRGKWSVNYEKRHGLVSEKRTRTWTGKTVIEKSNRNYKSRTEIKKSFMPWSYKSTTVSYDKRTGKLTMTEQNLTQSWWTGKLKTDGQAKVTQIDTRKLKNEIRDKTVIKAIEKAEKTLKADDFEKALKAIEEYQKYQTRQAALASVEIRYEKGYDKTERGQDKEAFLGSGRNR